MVVVRRRRKKKNRSLKIFLIVLFLGSVIFFVNKNFAESGIIIPDLPKSDTSNVSWWDPKYAFRKKILINNNSKGIIEISHAQMNIDGKSNTDGSDLKIIGFDENNRIEIPFEYDQFDQIKTRLAFDPSKFNYDEYYLYYGNKGAYGVTNSSAKQKGDIQTQNSFSLNSEEKTIIQISSLKKWFLKGLDELSKVNIKVSSELDLNESNTFYVIDKENQHTKVNLDSNSIEVDLSDLKPGIHEFFIISDSGGEINRSNTITLRVSEPIYIAWTLDWEGVDPKQEYLDLISDITSDFNIKVTHFFNPRILISLKIDSARKKELVAWVKNRHENLKEDIAMHLHMHHDVVEEAGVNAKYNAKTWDKGVSGFDIPSTEYNYDEYLKILKWGKEKMIQAGLPEPKGFRAGGWFANLDNLRAMQDAGFEYDSSARVPMAIGQNELIQPWDITTKTQPYKISKIDQNSDILPTLNLLEIPNNGSDSYWSEVNEMIQNFYDNYSPGTIADHSRLVTYLSHPEWFYIDYPKLVSLYTELNKYRIDLDNGPVKFVTLSEWRELEDR